MNKDLIILKIHSHPNGHPEFSEVDDKSDASLCAAVSGWLRKDCSLVSAVMLPDGQVFARVCETDERFIATDSVLVADHDIRLWFREGTSEEFGADHFQRRTAQTFGKGTTMLLSKLTVGVVGASGTGSAVVEMLYRLGVGKLVIVDADSVEGKNVGRIYNSTVGDAEHRQLKVDVLASAILRSGLPTTVVPIPYDLYHEDAIRQLAQCDIVFGCMDTVDGRDLLNKLAVYYCIPYFDLGVYLSADGKGGVELVSGAIHYVIPDGPALLDRKAYTSDDLRVHYMKRFDPTQYDDLLKDGYIHGVNEDRPAVISVNTLAASLAINDFLARIHSYRWFSNENIATIRMHLSETFVNYEGLASTKSSLARYVGLGDVEPLLKEPNIVRGE